MLGGPASEVAGKPWQTSPQSTINLLDSMAPTGTEALAADAKNLHQHQLRAEALRNLPVKQPDIEAQARASAGPSGNQQLSPMFWA